VARSLLSFGGTTRARERSAGRPRLAGGGVRVDERDDVPFVDAGHDGAALGAVDDLDVAAIEVLADLQEDEGLAVLLEHRLARHLDGVLDLAALDHDAQRRSGAHLRVGLLELEIDVELADRARLEEVAARRAGGERADLGGEGTPRNRVDLDG